MCKLKTLIILLLATLCFANKIYAQSPQIPQQEFYKAQVISVDKEGERDIDGFKNIYQDLKAKILDGPDKDKIVSLENGGQTNITSQQKVSAGDIVILSRFNSPNGGNVQYFIADKYRLDYLPYLLVFFLILVFLIAGKKGVGSLLGLAISLAIISLWIVPQILHNQDPLFVSIIGALSILFITTYLAHGISKQTTIALISTFVSLMVTAFLSIFIVNLTKLAGLGDENAYSLQLGSTTQSINLQGLLLGGIIIGTLGALNDVTTTQSATIFEIFKENPLIKFENLVKKGLVIGKEHIVSLVNTLVLAYAGASLAIIIFFVLNPAQQPYWVILNSETIFDEIVRTIAGSVGLILAVPIVTFLAAWYVSKK